MRIWWLNSRKCSIPNATTGFAVVALLAFFHSPTAQSSLPPTESLIKQDILSLGSRSFDPLLQQWEKKYGSRAVAPLLRIVLNRSEVDAHRFIALMGAARLGGPQTAPAITRLLKDRSWMIRSGTLRALRILRNSETAPAVIPLLKDPALVVRSEAVDAIEVLRPPGHLEALLGSLKESSNYHAGKAQWVPQKALSALVRLKAGPSIAPQLCPLLHRSTDPALQKQTIETLEALTGRKLRPAASLSERIKAWDDALRGRS